MARKPTLSSLPALARRWAVITMIILGHEHGEVAHATGYEVRRVKLWWGVYQRTGDVVSEQSNQGARTDRKPARERALAETRRIIRANKNPRHAKGVQKSLAQAGVVLSTM